MGTVQPERSDRTQTRSRARTLAIASDVVKTFPAASRGAVGALAATAPAFGDLATSFPALLFALATGYGTAPARALAHQQVLEGAPLKAISDTLALPMWLRQVPASAFTRPLGPLPCSPEFCTLITNALPASANLAALWLRRVQFAAETNGDAFALWIARHYRRSALPLSELVFCHLAAWAWYSHRPDLAAGRIVRKPWKPDMGIKRAVEETQVWRRRVALAAALAARPAKPWLDGRDIDGVSVVPLMSVADFIAEAAAMDNCLDQFSDRIETGLSWVYSLRRGGRPIADVEIGLTDPAGSVPTVLQLRGPRNRPMGPDVWRIVYRWLVTSELPVIAAERPRTVALKRQRSRMWAPFLAGLPRPVTTTYETLADVMAPARGSDQAS
jgi:hypothetical protein